MPATAMLRSFSFNNIHATVGQLFAQCGVLGQSASARSGTTRRCEAIHDGIIHFQAGLERPQHEVIGSEEDKSDY